MKKKYKTSKISSIILLFILLCGLSFLITAGIIKLIFVCFGLAFSWKIALGTWLILLLLNGIGSATVKTK